MSQAACRKSLAACRKPLAARATLKLTNPGIHMETVIALDVGHSAVKVVADSGGHRQQLMFRSVAIPAFHISED